jgi:hypothetical protein
VVAFWQLLACRPTRAVRRVVAQWIPTIPLRRTGFGGFQVPWGFRARSACRDDAAHRHGIGTLIHVYSTAYMVDEPAAGSCGSSATESLLLLHAHARPGKSTSW